MTRRVRQAAILLAGAFVLAIAFLTVKSQAMSAGDVLLTEPTAPSGSATRRGPGA